MFITLGQAAWYIMQVKPIWLQGWYYGKKANNLQQAEQSSSGPVLTQKITALNLISE